MDEINKKEIRSAGRVDRRGEEEVGIMDDFQIYTYLGII